MKTLLLSCALFLAAACRSEEVESGLQATNSATSVKDTVPCEGYVFPQAEIVVEGYHDTGRRSSVDWHDVGCTLNAHPFGELILPLDPLVVAEGATVQLEIDEVPERLAARVHVTDVSLWAPVRSELYTVLPEYYAAPLEDVVELEPRLELTQALDFVVPEGDTLLFVGAGYARGSIGWVFWIQSAPDHK